MKSIKLLGLSLLVAASTQLSAVPMTSPVNGHEYEAIGVDGWLTWDQAEAAVPDGWYLATLTSEAENTWVYENLVQGEFGMQLWLGGRVNWVWLNEGPVARVSWVTGEVSDYTNWGSGEPNNASGVEYGPITINRFGDATWNDEGAWKENVGGYIIEKGDYSVPDAGSTFVLMGLGLLGLLGLRKK